MQVYELTVEINVAKSEKDFARYYSYRRYAYFY